MSDSKAQELSSVLMYRISNGLSEDHAMEQDLSRLGQAMQRMPEDALIRLSENHKLPLQATWDRFMQIPVSNLSRYNEARAEVSPHIVTYITLMKRFNPECLNGHEDKLFLIASSLGNRYLVSTMLEKGSRPSLLSSPGWSSIISAMQAEAGDCLELQVQSCKFNEDVEDLPRSFGLDKLLKTNLFVAFLDYAIECFRNTQGVSRRWASFGYCRRDVLITTLKVLIKNGAAVDAPYPPGLCFSFDFYWYSYKDPFLPPSCLEVAFYCCRALYEEMKHFSREMHDHLSRIEICKAAEQGQKHLTSYLKGGRIHGTAQKRKFLQTILLEVIFMRADFDEDSKNDATGASNGIVAKTLMDYGIRLLTSASASHSMGVNFTSTDVVTNAVTCLLRRSRDRERSGSVLSSLEHLFRLSGTLSPIILQESVDKHGTTTLSALAECDIRFSSAVPEKGGYAIVMAALLGNDKAVDMLLRQGFDIDCGFSIPELENPCLRTAVGHVLF